jgi:hypothetical protein
MGQIYRHSSQTLVWLGLAENGSDVIMDFLNEVGGKPVKVGLTHQPPEVFKNWSTALVVEDDTIKIIKSRSERVQRRCRMSCSASSATHLVITTRHLTYLARLVPAGTIYWQTRS